MAFNVERIASISLSVAALAFAGILIRREFVKPPPRVTILKGEESRFEPKWQTMASAGRRLGPERAPITLIEYSDFECPFCGQFSSTIAAVRKRFGNQVSYVYVHWPLGIHRFAVPAAVAAECAARQDRFDAIAEVLFAKKDSFGLKSWTSYAAEAGVRDTNSFIKCLNDPAARQMIDRGVGSAREMGVRFTPTLIVNGWRYGSTPTEAELVAAIEKLLRGEKPYPEYPDSSLAVAVR